MLLKHCNDWFKVEAAVSGQNKVTCLTASSVEGDMFAVAVYSGPLSAAECMNEDIYYNRDTED